ncbi:MAG: hypothetical protein K0R12_950 [Gammaproteobacteria bacterium]|jgi:hypothetical protein|nr:hypothetical protein [Gammaproteobacteria bacterium]
MQNTDNLLNLDAIAKASVVGNPYPYMVVSNALREEFMADLVRDFPAIQQGGSFPLSELQYGSLFAKLVQEMQDFPLKEIIAQKFEMDLTNRPAILTVRGFSREKDGRIHTDSKSKLITVLLYLNPDWQHQESGNLRILHNESDLDNYAAEIPSTAGTMLIFKVTDNCWHGYKPFVGTRRSIQLNYLVDSASVNKQLSRHGLSAKLKQLKSLFSARYE